MHFFIFFCGDVKTMPKYVYAAISLVGGSAGSLDALSGDTLQDGDCAVVFSQGYSYFYTLKENSGMTENIPYVICPDFNALTKRWVLDQIMSSTVFVDTKNFTGLFKTQYNTIQKVFEGLNSSFNNKCFNMVSDKFLVKDVDFDTTSLQTLLLNSTSFSDVLSKLDTMFNSKDFKVKNNKVSLYNKPQEILTDSILTDQTFVIASTKEMQDVHITLNSCKNVDHVKIARSYDTYTTKIYIHAAENENIEGMASISLDKAYANVQLISDEKATWYRI